MTYNIGKRVSPIGNPAARGVVIELGTPDPDYVTVLWAPGVVADGTPNPIEEYVGDLVPLA